MTKEKIDVFQNLDAKPGDVVRCVKAEAPVFIEGKDYLVTDNGEILANSRPAKYTISTFQIVSRAAELPYGHARLPSGTVVDLTALTTPFGLLDADTQAALKAHGGPYQSYYGPNGWVGCDAKWCDCYAYRVAPKPAVETVTEDMWLDHSDGWVGDATPGRTPVTRTFTRINGEIDLASYRLTARKEGAE